MQTELPSPPRNAHECTEIHTNSMEQVMSKRGMHSQLLSKFLHTYMAPEVRYCVHRSSPLASVRSQLNSAHILTPSTYFNAHFNNVFPSTPNSVEWSLKILRLNFIRISVFHRPCYMPQNWGNYIKLLTWYRVLKGQGLRGLGM
jgi:hypothetical protein